MGTHIVQISVKGLFGDRDIDIRLPDGERVAFLHGSNGIGKSTILQLVNALYGMRQGYLRRVNFDSLVVTMVDGQKFGVRREHSEEARREGPVAGRFGLPARNGIDLVFYCDDTEWTPRAAESTATIMRHLGGPDEWPLPLRRLAPDILFDIDSGLELDELAVRYPQLLPASVLTDLKGDPPPLKLQQVAEGLTVEYVGADRLTGAREARGRFYPGAGHRPRSAPSDGMAVVDRQRDALNDEIGRALADYAEYSQSLDRTFPLRLLDTLASKDEAPSSGTIRSQVNEVAGQRSRFEEVGLLDRGQEELTPDRAADAGDNERRMLGLYLQDVRHKLQRLDKLAARLALFQRLVNAKFERKRIAIERAGGYTVRDFKGREINPSQLSSGEQHELVLLHRLIFASPGPLLFLIDEPELSLHVAWQQSVTEDLADIASLADAQFILATHSPIVTGDRWELLTALNVTYPNHE